MNSLILTFQVIARYPIIYRVYSCTGETFVIIIDEYDVLVRESSPILPDYLKFLNSLFKNEILLPAISLGYLTGILPILRDKVQSKLNLFREYSMLDADLFADFVGFTVEETEQLCKEYGMNFEECRRWYDGYCINGRTESVVDAMIRGRFSDYWCQTGSYEVLKDYILLNLDGMRDDVVTMIGGGRVKIDVTSYVNSLSCVHSKDDVFTFLIHLGYLTYDCDSHQCYIPNDEIRNQWVLSIK